jgi:hypothetical protein
VVARPHSYQNASCAADDPIVRDDDPIVRDDDPIVRDDDPIVRG